MPHAHEYVAKRWIDQQLSQRIVRAKFTKGALEFIKANRVGDSVVLITLTSRYVGSRKGPYTLPCPEVRLGLENPEEDLVKVESDAGISVLVVREIYEVLKQKGISLTVATSGFWKFKRLDLAQDLSWILYSKEEMQRKGKRWPSF
jgi:hypothetical protein